MADIKIQDLNNEVTLTDNHLLIIQGSSETDDTKNVRLEQIKSYVNNDINNDIENINNTIGDINTILESVVGGTT